jgi:hypothetical protein
VHGAFTSEFAVFRRPIFWSERLWQNARKSMKYARSEPHIDEMLSSLCASKWLDAASFDAVAEHKTSFQHHFLRRSDKLSAEEKRNYDMVRSILVRSFGA